MIIVKLGFLLGLPLPQPKEAPSKISQVDKKDKNGKKSKNDKKGTSKASTAKKAKSKASKKKSKSSKKSESSGDTQKTKPEKEKPPLPEYAFEVGKPKGYFHIEYTLFPRLEPIHIDVLHWEVFSKIYYHAKTVTYKNMINDDTIWIPVMLEHLISDVLTTEELVALPNLILEFIVSPNKKKMSAEAKNEKAKMFFIKAEDINNECYVQAYETDPNILQPIIILEKKSNESITPKPKRDTAVHFRSSTLALRLTITEFESLLHLRFQKIIQKLGNGEQVAFKQYIPPPPPPLPEDYEVKPQEDDVNNYTWPKVKKSRKDSKAAKSKTEKKSDKSKKGTSKKTGKTGKTVKPSKKEAKAKIKKEARIKVSGESFCTDAALCTYGLNEEVENVKHLFIVFSTLNLTKKIRLTELNPIVIKLKSLRNLPVEYLVDQNVSSIYLQYNIPSVARHITQPIHLEDIKGKKLQINESHIFFGVPLPELSFFLNRDRLFVELIGVYNDVPPLKPSLYGSERSDFVRIPARPAEVLHPKPKSQVLAVACYDLSLLALARMSLELTEPLYHPSNANAQKITETNANAQFRGSLTIEQIHLNYRRDYHPSPLLDGILFEAETTLKVEVCLGFQMDKFYTLPDPVIKYKRLLFILYDMQIASYLLGNILCYNQKFLKNVLLKNYHMYTENLNAIEDIDRKEKIMTGFWIDTGSCVILFLEGCNTSYCMEIVLHQLRCMNESLCRIYHNPGVYYYNRIYEKFLAFGGIYKVTLKYDLQKIFQVKWTHCRRYVPKPAFDVIKKLQYLLEMQSMFVMSQHAVFPTANELLSFDMEFGVPHVNDRIY